MSPRWTPSTATASTWRCSARARPRQRSSGCSRVRKKMMKLLESRLRRSLLFSLFLLLLSVSAHAGEKAPQGVQLSIGTILASNESDDFDAKLSKMKNQLEVIKYRSEEHTSELQSQSN